MARKQRSRTGRARPSTPDSFWQRLSPTARHAVCLGALLLLSLSYFAPIHFGGQSLYGGDIVNWRGMAQSVLEYQEETGEDALWAPNAFAGMPAYLIKYTPDIPQLDTVIDALRGFLWPTSHFFLLLGGMYVLGVYLTRNSFAALLSSVAFGMYTYMPIILGAGHQTKFVALAYAPLVVLAFVYALRSPSFLSSLLFAAALALQLRANHPQITYYVLFLIGVWWVVELVRALREGEGTTIGKSTGWLALGTVLALLMVAQPYLATYEYKAFSTRGAASGGAGGDGSMGWQNAMRWSQGVGELVTLAIADAFGGARLYWGPKPFTGGPHYVGGIVLALAGLALWRVRSRTVWGLGVGVLLTILFALGRHAAWINQFMFDYFPFFDAFRAPETWLSVTVLALAVLAGFGLNHVLTRSDASTRSGASADDDKRTRSMLIAFGAVFGVVAFLWIMGGVFFDFERPQERQLIVQQIQQQRPDLSAQDPQVQRFIDQQMAQLKDQRADAFGSDARRTLLFLALGALALWLYRRGTLPYWATGFALVLLVMVDLWGVDKRYLGADEFVDAQRVTQQIPTYGFDRYIKEQVQEAGGAGHFRVLSLEGAPFTNARPSYHYESLGGYHGAKLRRYQDYIDHILQLNRQGRPNENALDILNTRYIVARQQLPGTRVVHRDEQTGLLVLENTDAVPRAFFVGQTEVIESAEQTYERLRSDSFDPSQTAIVPEPLDQPVAPVDSASTAEVSLQSYTPNEMAWAVETDAPRLLVVSEIYYPAGWNAYINGEQVPIHRADYLLRAVHVPAGEHTVTMRFEPRADQLGTWISGLSTALVYGGIIGIVGLAAYRRRKDSAEVEAEPDEVEA